MNELLRAIAGRHGTPAFVLSVDEIDRRIAELGRVFEDRFELSYAVKANPHPLLLRLLRERVPFLDVSSAGEIERALIARFEGGRLTLTGPGKQARDFGTALDAGVAAVVLESVDEAWELAAHASTSRDPIPVLVRLTPKKLPAGFGVRMSGRPTVFGVDEEDMEAALRAIRGLPGLSLRGFHIYSGTQCLKPESVAKNFGIMADLFRHAARVADISPEILIFGSGIGIPYTDGDEEIDLDALAAEANPIFDKLRKEPRFKWAKLLLELGRYLVGPAGVYLTRVIRVKRSRGVDIAVLDGGMHHHLGATGNLGSVIRRNYPIAKLPGGSRDVEPRPYDLAGPLCTSIDTLGHEVMLPGLEPGDLLIVRSSGAYGPTASPSGFISHPPAYEVFVEQGEVIV